MPSTLIGNPVLSGPQPVVSGWPWSGQIRPQGGIQFRWISSGGNCYIGLSGGMTLTSGGMFLSGGSWNDGMILNPGDSYWVPRIADGISGTFGIWAICDAAASGIGRLYFEVF